jgi:hypothetical protein
VPLVALASMGLHCWCALGCRLLVVRALVLGQLTLALRIIVVAQLRLCRLVDLTYAPQAGGAAAGPPPSLGSQTRVPAGSRLQKMRNADLALVAMTNEGALPPVHGAAAADARKRQVSLLLPRPRPPGKREPKVGQRRERGHDVVVVRANQVASVRIHRCVVALCRRVRRRRQHRPPASVTAIAATCVATTAKGRGG